MTQSAIIVTKNMDFIVMAKPVSVYESTDLNVGYSSIYNVFMRARSKEVAGGVLFIKEFPTLDEMGVIIGNQISRVVCKKEPITSDELMAFQLAKEKGVEVIVNEKIIF